MVKVYIDGGSRGNPGEAAIGVVIYDGNDREIYRSGRKIGKRTNNVAEYSALIDALEHLNSIVSNPDEKILIFSDSELLVKQIIGLYRVRDKKLQKLYNRAKELLKKFNNLKIEHINRDENKLSDWIVNQVLDGKEYRPADWPRKQKASEESPGS